MLYPYKPQSPVMQLNFPVVSWLHRCTHIHHRFKPMFLILSHISHSSCSVTHYLDICHSNHRHYVFDSDWKYMSMVAMPPIDSPIKNVVHARMGYWLPSLLHLHHSSSGSNSRYQVLFLSAALLSPCSHLVCPLPERHHA